MYIHISMSKNIFPCILSQKIFLWKDRALFLYDQKSRNTIEGNRPVTIAMKMITPIFGTLTGAIVNRQFTITDAISRISMLKQINSGRWHWNRWFESRPATGNPRNQWRLCFLIKGTERKRRDSNCSSMITTARVCKKSGAKTDRN